MASQSPNSTATASAHPMSSSLCGPISIPAAHFQTAQWWPTTIPIPKDELASPHQPMLAGSWWARGTMVGEIDMIYLTQDRLAVTKEGGVFLALGERKLREKWAIEGRKGLM